MKTFAKMLLAFLLAAGALDSAAQVIGRVLVVAGQVTVERQGQPRAAVVGTGLEVGDTVVTGPASNTQLRFSDNSIVALREASRFLVERYSFGDARGTGALTFNLLKGGLRTVTGLIGKSRRAEDYLVKTPIASVGVRGTQYALLHCADDCGSADGTLATNGTYGGVFEGRLGVFNSAGDVEFGRDEFFYVADINTIPQPLLGPPAFLADRLRGLAKNAPKPASEPAAGAATAAGGSAPASEGIVVPVAAFAATDTRGAGGTPVVVGAAAPDAAFTFTHALVEIDGGNSSYGGSTLGTAIPIFPPDLMTISGSGPTATLTAFNLGAVIGRTGTVGPGGIDMQGFDPASGVHWGRWVDGRIAITAPDTFLSPGTQVPPGGVHYMFGASPTPDNVLASKAGSVSFTDFGGTIPTDSNGQIATSFTFGAMNVNFTAQTASMDTINITFPTASWSYSNIAFTFQHGAGRFTHLDSNQNNIGSCTGAGCGSAGNASLDASGVFLGTSANFLALGLQGNAGAGVTSNRVAWTSARIYRCPTCP